MLHASKPFPPVKFVAYLTRPLPARGNTANGQKPKGNEAVDGCGDSAMMDLMHALQPAPWAQSDKLWAQTHAAFGLASPVFLYHIAAGTIYQ